jgi:non-specific serine/threonine protein kinase
MMISSGLLSSALRMTVIPPITKYIFRNSKTPKASLRCACPYNLGDICRHEAAALFQLQELIDRGHLQADNVIYDQRHTVAKMKTIDLKTCDLSVKNPDGGEEVVHRSPQAIMDEIAVLDNESAEVLANIRALL